MYGSRPCTTADSIAWQASHMIIHMIQFLSRVQEDTKYLATSCFKTSISSAVAWPDVRVPSSDQDQEDRPSLVPRAFQERLGVRLAYLNTVIANVFGKQSIQAATDTLNNQLNCMLLEGVLPEHPRPVHHLLSAKRRLGIDPDQWITQYAICPECWKHLTPNQLKELPSPECTVPDCPGVLYDERTDAKGKCIRITRKIMPHVSLIGSLRQMFMRPGFAKSIRDSRQDQPQRNNDNDYVMTDIHDGMLWHELETNTVHEIGELGTFKPVLLMGILENQPHSSGPIYYAINDLPRNQRFLQVNVICAAIMPGPKEPNIQQINHCLEPSTRELMDLKNSVKMDVHGEEEAADVFADNKVLACNMPASHKCNGTAGHSHDFHPCAFCDADVVKINTPDGYNNTWSAKDDFHMLHQSFYSRDAGPARQEAILRDHGVRWSILNLLSGWLPSKKSVLDFMHCIFLDQINHIIKVQAQDRGSMMMQIAVYQSEAAEDNVRLPLRTAKLINLHTYGSPQGVFYPILLQYFRSLWPDLNLVGDLSCDNGTPFYVNKVARALTYIHKDGIRNGCTMNRCTHSDSFAFISQGRTHVPVQIMALFVVGVLDVVPHVCAVARRLVSDDNIPAMPWDLNASTLGIHVSYAELGPQEVIPVSWIECPLALIPVYSNIIKKDLWITISFDHVSVQITLV
ncbi:hypothetical protein DFH29DRAFT_877950 [Suillus ampliporus]|nr:hypothetical protein DFH29DRAFT_877950 [Suillus ampliporus]